MPGGVVDDDLDTGDHVEGADIAAVTTDDTSLHVVGRKLDDGDGALHRQFSGEALDGPGDDLLRLAVRIGDTVVLDLLDLARGELAGTLFLLLDQHASRLGGTDAGDLFESLALLADHVAQPCLFGVDGLLTAIKLLLHLQQAAFLALEHVDLAVELLFALLQACFELAQRPLRVLQFAL